jgi:hypothetical protein
MVFSFRSVFYVPGFLGFNGVLRGVVSIINHGPFRGDLRLLNYRFFGVDDHFRFWLVLFFKGMEIFWDGGWFKNWEWLLSKGSEGQSSKRKKIFHWTVMFLIII